FSGIAASRSHSRCKNVTSLLMDAADYEPPAGPMVALLADPFSANMVERVPSRIEVKHQTSGNPVYLLYYAPEQEKIIRQRVLWKALARGEHGIVFKSER